MFVDALGSPFLLSQIYTQDHTYLLCPAIIKNVLASSLNPRGVVSINESQDLFGHQLIIIQLIVMMATFERGFWDFRANLI